MRPWTIDADDIHLASDFDSHLLHKTPAIQDFLDEDRDDKFIVVATKGFGKTLLLKAKRIAYQKAGRRCIPSNSLLDKPVGDKVFSRDMVALYGDSQPWQKLWLVSIAVTVLKELELADGAKVSGRLAGLLADRSLKSVLDHFVNLLDFPRNELFRCANDTDNKLVPRLRTVNAPVAIFIDSIDEYFNKHLQREIPRARETGEIAPEVWYLSQAGLVQVAYQLRRISHHLKVFAAVRKEAFEELVGSAPMAQQYRGSAVDISYTAASLREIFLNNVQNERQRNLVDRSRLRDAAIEAFLGRKHVSCPGDGEGEDVFDYLLRHTLRRPRDLMTMGQRLAGVKPEERRFEERLRGVVHAASTEIADAYLNEIEPYLGHTDLREVLHLLPSNVLSRSDLMDLGERYDRLAVQKGRDGGSLAFRKLLSAGLLGYVKTDARTGSALQHFLVPGEVSLMREAALPQSTHYLVHPMLNDVIARSNPEFATSVDPAAVIGSERPWVDPRAPESEVREQSLFILHADIANFSSMMKDSRVDQSVRRALNGATKRHAAACLCFEVVRGDSLAIVHDEPNVLLKAASRIREDLFEAPGHPQLRMAVDYGPVKLRRRRRRKETLAGGHALWRVARIEPLVGAGEIWGTDEFREQLEKYTSLYTALAVQPDASGPGQGRFNIRKPGSDEPDAFVRLYRITPGA